MRTGRRSRPTAYGSRLTACVAVVWLFGAPILAGAQPGPAEAGPYGRTGAAVAGAEAGSRGQQGPAVVGAGFSRPEQPSPAPLTLDVLERLALERNPTIIQARTDVEAARGRARQAGLLPNPTIGYQGEEISFGEVIRGGEHGVFVDQRLPLGGKLRLSRKVFEQEATRAEALVDLQRQRVLNSVRMLYYEALGAARRVEVRERLAQLATEAVTVSRQLYNVGAADETDVLVAEVEGRDEQLALDEARNAQFRVWRQLAAAVGDPTLMPQRLDGAIDAPLPELARDEVLRATLEQSPEVRAARAGIEQATASLERARREPAPDLFLRGGPRYNRELLETGQRPVGWEAGVEAGVTIPLFNRNQGGVATAAAAVGRARADVTRVQLSIESRVAEGFASYLTALRRAEVYRADVLPRAERAYQLYLTKYRDMAAAYPQVLIAQRTVFQANEQYIRALERTWRAATHLRGYMVGALGAPDRLSLNEDPGQDQEGGRER